MKRWIIFFFLLSLIQFLYAQNECTIEVCNNDDCGSVFVTYSPSGQNVFCEGGQVNLENTSRTLDFDYFIVDWGDDNIDTIYDYNNVIHVYDFQGIDRCAEGPIFNQPFCYIGYKSCAGGFSCNYASSVVSVRLKPVAIFDTEDEICIDDLAAFSNVSCNADTYLWDFGDGNTSTEANPDHQYTSPGRYTVRLEATNQCGKDIMTKVVNVIGLPDADAMYDLNPTSGCLPLTVTFTNNSATDNRGSQRVTWEFDPSSGWNFTDTIFNFNSWDNEVRFTTPGTYDVTLTMTNICGEDSWMDSIVVLERPRVSVSNIGSYCLDQGPVTINLCDFTTYSGSIFGYDWTISDTDGNIVETSQQDCPSFTFSSPGDFIALIQVDGGPCGNIEDEVSFSVQEPGDIQFQGIPPVICNQDSIFQIDVSPLGGTWTGSSAINQDSEFDPIAAGPGIHTLTYNVGSGACNTSKTLDITVLETPSVALDSIGPVCEQINYSPQVSYQGEISTYAWNFENGSPGSSNQSNPTGIFINTGGTHLVSIEVDGNCGIATDSFLLEVISLDPINISSPDLPVCNTSSPIVLEASPLGGTWSGPGILMDSIFDPSLVQPGTTVDVTYTYGVNNCTKSKDLSITVIESIPVEVDTGVILCIDRAPFSLDFSPTGGTWSGTGITDPAQGVFEPGIVGVGFHNLTYSFEDASGCIIDKSTQVEVEDFPEVQMDSFISFCLNPDNINLSDEFSYVLTPNFGDLLWFGPGITDSSGIFNSNQNGATGLGTYTVYYKYELNDCFIIDSTTIEIIEAPVLDAGKDTILCITNGDYQLNPSLSNGIWSGPGVNPNTGLINLDDAGGGTHQYTYTIFPGSTCEVVDQVEIEIIDFTGINAGSNLIICEDSPPITLTNFSPSGGTWSGPGITDSVVGVFDPSLLAADSTYTLNYCISSDQVSCTACDQITVRVNPKPAALFEIVGTTCIGEEIEINNLSNLGCDFSWSFGNGLTSTEENPRPVFNSTGDYTIQLIVNSCESCKDTISLDIFVTEPPHAEFAKDLNEGCAVLDVAFDNASFGTDVQYLWDFGNGVTDTISEPGVISFDQGTQDTTYYINLSAINGCGSVQFRDSVTVFPLPLTDFGTNVDDGCSPLEIEFANATLGNPDSFYWNLDGVFISSDTIIPNQIFTTGDSTVSTYNVTLIATNECGIDTFERIITVYPPNVEAFFHVDTTKGCQPLTVQLTNYSTPGASISWDFGDGNGSNATNPVHTFDSAGIFTIYQYASNCGTDTDSILIEVLPQPDVSFEVAPYACLNQETIFENTSQNTFGSSWDFGDGDSSIVFNPAHVFDSIGIYTVTLTGYSQLNNCPASFSQDVEIIGPPDIGFSPSRLDGCAPLEVDFQNTSQGARYFSWIFDDGNSSNAVNPRHVFEEPGRYAVTLIGTDSFGCFTDSTIVNIIAHDLPVSSFELNQNTFCSRVDTLQTINNSVDAVQNLWTFNEDVNFIINQPKLVWPDTGWIDIVLEVENQFGCRDTSVQNVYIKASPLADIVTDENEGCKPLRVQFTNNSRFSNLSFWDFGDGNTRNILSPTHTYLSDGSFVATFIASHSNNCPSDTVQVPIEVYPLPVSSFSPGDTVICGLPVDLLFQNNSSGAVNYDWDIGALNSNNFEPIVTFDQEGSVDVRLIASTQFDCKDTSYHTVHLNEQPVALFSPEDLETCELENIQFNSLSLDADFWLWDFGDGGQSQEENPIYQYREQGTYTVSLMVGNNDVCFDTLTAINGIVVRNGPIADFDWSDEGKGFIQFANLSQEADFYNWDFNDGTPISNSVSPLHEFWDNGNWEVTLTAISINGCENAITKTVSPDFFFGLYVPNAFSPENGIGEVRLFKPKGKGIVDYHMQVYSPWGEQVWSSTVIDGEEPGKAWDGTYKGAILPQGAYVWKVTVEFVNGKREVRTGTVVLLR